TDAGLEPTVRSAPIAALDVAIVAAFAAAEETIAADVVRGAGGGVEATIRVTGEDAAREGEVPAGLPGQVLAVAFLEALDGAVAAVRRLAAARVEGALGRAREDAPRESQAAAVLAGEVGGIALLSLVDHEVAAQGARVGGDAPAIVGADERPAGEAE